MVDWNPIDMIKGMLTAPVGPPRMPGTEKKSYKDKGTPSGESAKAPAAAAAPPPDPTQQLVDALRKAFPTLAGGGGIQGSPAALQSWQHNILQPQLQKSVDAVKGANTQYEQAMQHLLGGSSSPTAKMMLGQMPGVEAMNTGLIQGMNTAMLAGPAAAAQQQSQQAQQTDTMKLYDMFQKLLAYVDPTMSAMTNQLGGGLGGGLTPQGLQQATGTTATGK